MMSEAVMRYYEVVRWAAEFSMLPLHFLALNNLHEMASVLGGLILLTYAAMAAKHEQMQRQMQGAAH
jgi:hypothetical protein